VVLQLRHYVTAELFFNNDGRILGKSAPDFERNGSLRDIYAQSATLADWDLTLQVVLRDYVPATFTRDGELAALPVSADDVFAERDSAALTLRFEVAGIELACHFFSPEEIEFDLLPKQVNSHERFAALQSFLRSFDGTTLRDFARLVCGGNETSLR